MVNQNGDADNYDLNEKCMQLSNQIDILNQELSKEKQVNNTTKDYLLLLESKIIEFDKQKEIINSLNNEVEKLKNEIIAKDNEINNLKKEIESSKLMESYITKLLDLKNDLNKI